MATGSSETSFAEITQLDQQVPEPQRHDQQELEQQGLERQGDGRQRLDQRMSDQKIPEHLQYVISGVIDFSTVQVLASKITKICESYKRSASTGKKPATEVDVDLGVELDFSQVTQCNSAGLALILEMSKTARTNNLALHYKNLPTSLLSIAKAYGVECEIRELGK